MTTSTKRTKGRQKAASSAKMARDSGESAPKPAEKPVSLAPLEFEEALKGLLQVKPEKHEK
jgi:hypothetical protein